MWWLINSQKYDFLHRDIFIVIYIWNDWYQGQWGI